MRFAPRKLELVLVAAVALGVLAPGISTYTLVDPWETHYGEVARNMLVDGDLVHMQWPGTNDQNQPNEGFRSKPILQFWMMAASLRMVGLASHGGYSGELEHDPALTAFAIRVPFVAAAVLGLVMLWWMLARLVDRRAAWLALLVVGSCPMYCLIARQAMPDMPMTATVIGSLAMFALAVEDGDRPIVPLLTLRGRPLDARHIVLGVCGGFLAAQAIYYAVYFILAPQLAVLRFPSPAIVLPLLIALLAGGMSRIGFTILRGPAVVVGAAIAYARTRSWRDWERYAPDRLALRAVAYPFVRDWAATAGFAERVLTLAPITTMRQVYLLWCYAFLGVAVLAKGPPGLGVVGFVGIAHVVLGGRWRALLDGEFELKRGILLMLAIFLPWHLAMFLKDGVQFINEYVFTHIIERAAGTMVDKEFGTFEKYLSQIGIGMWLWASLLPAAVAAALLRARADTREGRVRAMVLTWAIGGLAFFCLVETRYHHYLLPVVPALGVLVALFLDDLWAGRDRLHPLYAAIAIAIVALVARDLVWDPKAWINMFIFRYDRPWPSGEPWAIDPSDGFLVLGLAGAFAIAVAATRWRRVGVVLLGVAGLAICLWALRVYMPIAATHWGSGNELRTYYRQRTIYGEKLVYFGAREVYDDWHDVTSTWKFDTFVPDALQVGQPMTITVVVKKLEDERVTEQELALIGHVAHVGDHSVEVELAPGQRALLDPIVKRGATGRRGPPALHAVDADRLLVWQMYWRGEQFWTNGEIWGEVPELKTTFDQSDNVMLLKYLNDHTRAPLGRRYFVITDGGHASGMKSVVPTSRGRETYEVLDTSSNKFALSAFIL